MHPQQSVIVSPLLHRLRRLFNSVVVRRSPAENMLLELSNVRKIACREALYFQNSLFDDEKKRKRLNLLFVKDLLDGVNGMILDQKDRRDNERIFNQVEKWHKVLACIVLVTSCFGMLYYVYLFSMRQSASRQRAWFNSFQIWFFFEVFVISTGLVFVEHVLIPLWSLREVQRVKEKIVSDILTFQRRVKKMTKSKLNKTREIVSEEVGSLFNAAEYFFPSHRLAKMFPQYPESGLILRYSTPWPKKSFKRVEKSTRKRYDKRYEFITKTFSRIAIFTLSSMIQLPPSLQDMGLQMFLLTLCGAVVRFHMQLYEINPMLTFFPLFLLTIMIYVFFISGKKVRTLLSRTYPMIDAAKDETPEEEEEEEEKKIEHNLYDEQNLANFQDQIKLEVHESSDITPSISDNHEIYEDSDEASSLFDEMEWAALGDVEDHSSSSFPHDLMLHASPYDDDSSKDSSSSINSDEISLQ